jgi:hypothetical protein
VTIGSAKTFQLRTITTVLVILGVALMVLAVYYFITPAHSLPSFVPGHQAGSSHHHAKHGLAVGALAIVAWIGAWFSTSSSPKRHAA